MTRFAGVLVAAGCYAVACPPIDWSLAAWLVPGLLLTLVRGASPRRAVALARASASGTSAFVDPGGGIYDSIPRGSSGALVADVRPRTGLTPYVRWGDWWVAVAAGLLLVVARPWEHA